jgi:hypothetical protein
MEKFTNKTFYLSSSNKRNFNYFHIVLNGHLYGTNNKYTLVNVYLVLSRIHYINMFKKS